MDCQNVRPNDAFGSAAPPSDENESSRAPYPRPPHHNPPDGRKLHSSSATSSYNQGLPRLQCARTGVDSPSAFGEAENQSEILRALELNASRARRDSSTISPVGISFCPRVMQDGRQASLAAFENGRRCGGPDLRCAMWRKWLREKSKARRVTSNTISRTAGTDCWEYEHCRVYSQLWFWA